MMRFRIGMVLTLVLAVGTTLSTAEAAKPSWMLRGNPQQSNNYPVAGMQIAPKLAWSSRLTKLGYSDYLVAGQYIFGLHNDKKTSAMIALDSAGRVLWKFSPEGSLLRKAFVRFGDVVVVADSKNMLFGVDISKGSLAWKLRFGAQVGSVIVAKNTLLVGVTREAIHGLDPSTGIPKWKKKTPGYTGSMLRYYGATGGLLLYETSAHTVALRLRNRKIRWKKSLELSSKSVLGDYMLNMRVKHIPQTACGTPPPDEVYFDMYHASSGYKSETLSVGLVPDGSGGPNISVATAGEPNNPDGPGERIVFLAPASEYEGSESVLECRLKDLSKEWSSNRGRWGHLLGTKDVVYAWNSGELYAFDLDGGKVLWRSPDIRNDHCTPGPRSMVCLNRGTLNVWMDGKRTPPELTPAQLEGYLKHLKQQVTDPSDKVRKVALQNIGLLGSKAAPLLAAIRFSIEHGTRDFRVQALETMGKMGPKARSTLPVLRKYSQHKDIEMKLAALRAIGHLGEAANSEFYNLKKRMMDPKQSLKLRAALVLTLGKIGKPFQVNNLMVKLLESREEDIRHNAIRAIAHLGPKAGSSTVPLLHSLKNSTAAKDLELAGKALAQIGPSAMLRLRLILKGNEPELRRVAVGTLAGWKAKAAPVIPTLLPLLLNPYKDTAAQAKHTLVEIGDAALPALEKQLEHKDPAVRKAALEVIVEFRQQVIPLLLKHLKSGNRALKEEIALALTRLGPSVVKPVAQLLQDKDPYTRGFAALALGRLTYQATHAYPQLVAAQKAEKETFPRKQIRRAILAIKPAVAPKKARPKPRKPKAPKPKAKPTPKLKAAPEQKKEASSPLLLWLGTGACAFVLLGALAWIRRRHQTKA